MYFYPYCKVHQNDSQQTSRSIRGSILITMGASKNRSNRHASKYWLEMSILYRSSMSEDLCICWIRSGRIEFVAGRIAGLSYQGGTTVIGSDGRQIVPIYGNSWYSTCCVQ
jgi:hypothetical protein